MTHLILLDLSHQRLDSLGKLTLAGLRSLRTLDLHGNQINQIHQGAFSSLTSIISMWVHMQGCIIWHPNWVRLTPNETNLGLFKISFSTFSLCEPKCTETDLKKSQICSILGPIYKFGSTLTSLGVYDNKRPAVWNVFLRADGHCLIVSQWRWGWMES